jgi:triphosphoribosyl-dephospho-CoA synthase
MSLDLNINGYSRGSIARRACVIEASASKPGNVGPERPFSDMTFEDMIKSAEAIVDPFDRAVELGVGGTILAAVERTRSAVCKNTNLGMILALAPLASVPDGVAIRDGIGRVLAELTVEDARLAYEAIRLAEPGGLGTSNEQDVARPPTVNLLAAMTIARDRDLIARQYVNSYVDVFDTLDRVFKPAIGRGLSIDRAVVLAYLDSLARLADSLVARKRGVREANEVARRARLILESSPEADRPDEALLNDFDAWLREEGSGRNPGATADLIAAMLYTALVERTIEPAIEFDARRSKAIQLFPTREFD